MAFVDHQFKMIIDKLFDVASPKLLALVAAGGLVVYYVGLQINKERRIRALGQHAVAARSYLPFGIDVIIYAVYCGMHHTVLNQWQGWFRQAKQHTIEVYPGGLRTIITAEPENIKAILATQFHDYGKGESFRQDFHDFLGDSIFTTDLAQWHDSRQLIRPQFIKDRVSDLATFERHIQILLEAIANGGVKGSPGVANDGIGRGRVVSIDDLFFRFTLDASTDFLLGKSVDSLKVQEQEFANAFQEVQRVQNMFVRAGPAKVFIPRRTFDDGLKVINEFVNPYVERTLQLSPEELSSKTKSEHDYMFLHALAGFTRDRVVLRDQLVAVLLAGRDTTACTLSWTFYELARNPEAVKKLRKEILDTIGSTNTPTYEDLKNMKYLQNVMNETLRLYPVVPYNVRMALKDTTLPRGGGPDGMSPIGILKDTPIAYSTLAMQRREDLYPPGSDHLKFIPERWETWQPKPWTYVPFNGGPRICIGQQFALTEMAYTIVRILQKFDRIDNHQLEIDNGDPMLKAEIVLQPGQGVKVGLWEAK